MDEIKNLGIKIKDNFLKIKNKKNLHVISLGILGIVLILISEILPEKKEDKIPVSAESCDFEKNPAPACRHRQSQAQSPAVLQTWAVSH